MGRPWVVMLALLAACSDRYGAYFTIEGHDAIQFDRVELYFGEEAGMKVPVPPGHVATEPEPGLLMRRLARATAAAAITVSSPQTLAAAAPTACGSEGSEPIADDVVTRLLLPRRTFAGVLAR